MKKIAFFLLLSLLLSSCSTIKFIDIDVRKPAEVTLGQGIENIAIVNNAVTQPDDVGHWIGIAKETEDTKASSDSLDIILVQALTQFIEEDGFYNTVTAYDETLRKDKEFLVETIVPASVIDKIVKETNADLIISLDKIMITSVYNFNIINKKTVPWKLNVGVDTRLRIYTTDSEEKPREVIFRDSIVWRGTWEGNYYSENIPSYKKAFEFTVLRTADKIAKALSPAWESERRWYYSNATTQMKQAAVKVSAGEWKEAAIIWGEIFEKENNENKKGKLASNISLANEMLDDIENAITWLDIALDSFKKAGKKGDSQDVKLANNYKEKLRKRLLDFEKLDIQLATDTTH